MAALTSLKDDIGDILLCLEACIAEDDQTDIAPLYRTWCEMSRMASDNVLS